MARTFEIYYTNNNNLYYVIIIDDVIVGRILCGEYDYSRSGFLSIDLK